MRFLCLISVPIIVLCACTEEPNYPPEPSIDFFSISTKHFKANKVDTITVVVYFRDGDGDLGLNSSQTSPPYSEVVCKNNPRAATSTCPGNTKLNPFRYNYFIKVFKKSSSGKEEVKFTDNATFNGRFPHLSNVTKPIEGNLSYKLGVNYDVFGSPLSKGDDVSFEIQIADRALNMSNTISTTEVKIGQ